MSDMAMLRIGILAAGLLLIAAILVFGRPRRKSQGRRVDAQDKAPTQRREPQMQGAAGEVPDADAEPVDVQAAVEQGELGLDGTPVSSSELGRRE